jgi:membrane protease YdiL (CAAX protease family)
MPFTIAMLCVVLVYTWIVEPRVPRGLVGVPAAIVVGLAVWHAIRSGEWGAAPHALGGGARASALFTAAGVMLLLGIGAALGTLHDRRDFLGNLAVLVVWGGAQQWILQTVMLREAQRATSRPIGVVVAALLFAALHLPNPFLFAATLGGALGWCAIYNRYPNVLPLALSHALATLAILYAFDDTITGGLKIGAAYLAR